MRPEQRLDRAERILLMLAKAGDRARREFREKINILIDAQIRNERAVNEQIMALAFAQAELTKSQKVTDQALSELAKSQKVTDQALSELAKSQKVTDQALRALINSRRKGVNGNS